MYEVMLIFIREGEEEDGATQLKMISTLTKVTKLVSAVSVIGISRLTLTVTLSNITRC